MGKILKIILSLAIIGGIGYAGWHWMQKSEAASAPATPAAAPAMPVVTQKIGTRDVTVAINAVGSLLAGESAEIHSEIAGQIEKIYFEEGQPVKKGDILLQIDKSLIETELSKSKAAFEVANSSFARDDKLKSSGFLSNQKWDLSKSDLETARAAVENARIRLEKTAIRAPFDGIMSLRNFSVGDYTDVGRMLTTIVSINPLKVEFSIPEKNYSDVKQGQQISLHVDAFGDEAFNGTVYAVDPVIDPQTRNFKVKAEIPNADGRLRPGMYARISVATVTKKNVVMVPEEALIPKGDENSVMMVVDGKAQSRKVTIGLRDQGAAEVIEGLAPGDDVVTAGVMRLRDGMDVTEQSPVTKE